MRRHKGEQLHENLTQSIVLSLESKREVHASMSNAFILNSYLMSSIHFCFKPITSATKAAIIQISNSITNMTDRISDKNYSILLTF